MLERFWLLTWHTYGTWLPGDERGFVNPVIDDSGQRVIHNTPGTPCDADNPRLRQYAREVMRGDPIYLTLPHAEELLAQFLETARYREWYVLAVSILATHVHLLVAVKGDPDPRFLLRDFKSYGSGRLNRKWSKPVNGSWWSESGSKRKKATEAQVIAALYYVLYEQQNPLLTWKPPTDELERVTGIRFVEKC